MAFIEAGKNGGGLYGWYLRLRTGRRPDEGGLGDLLGTILEQEET